MLFVYTNLLIWLIGLSAWFLGARIRHLRSGISYYITQLMPSALTHWLRQDERDISGFQSAKKLHFGLALLFIISNFLALTIFLARSSTALLLSGSGQVIAANTIPMTLLAYPSIFLNWATRTTKPQTLWVHFAIGWIVVSEIGQFELHVFFWVITLPHSSSKYSHILSRIC